MSKSEDPESIFLIQIPKFGIHDGSMSWISFRTECHILSWVSECKEDDVGEKGYNNKVVMSASHGCGGEEVQQCQHINLQQEMCGMPLSKFVKQSGEQCQDF